MNEERKFVPFDGGERPNELEYESIGLESVTTFDEMYTILREQQKIVANQREYTPQEIIKRIDKMRNGHREVGIITRSHGIRAAVMRLMPNDKVYKKRVLDKKKK